MKILSLGGAGAVCRYATRDLAEYSDSDQAEAIVIGDYNVAAAEELAAESSAAPSPSSAARGDWPQWRFDSNRSGATDEPGPQNANLLWSKALPQPDPAYDHQYRMCADVTYAPIAAEGLVFVPSNVTDQIMALDMETGAVRWRYVVEGPVRFAPVYVDGKVCFASDDGYLVCVRALSGEVLWKVRGAPERLPDSRLLVNGKLCSRWPVRGADGDHRPQCLGQFVQLARRPTPTCKTCIRTSAFATGRQRSWVCWNGSIRR